jgi:hypothetical protein
MDAQIVHSSLEDYLAQLDNDKRTKYNGDRRYGPEDDAFLDDAADRVRVMLRQLKLSHPNIVVKG